MVTGQSLESARPRFRPQLLLSFLFVTLGKECSHSEPWFPHFEMEVTRALPQMVTGRLEFSVLVSAVLGAWLPAALDQGTVGVITADS